MNSKNYYKCRDNIFQPHHPRNEKKLKFDFKEVKKNTICSLNEVECFLCNFHSFFNYVKLYKILK